MSRLLGLEDFPQAGGNLRENHCKNEHGQTLLTLYLGLDVGASGETLDLNQKGWCVV
jgi:hypothetical protein